jgi:hypothetical protein
MPTGQKYRHISVRLGAAVITMERAIMGRRAKLELKFVRIWFGLLGETV